MIRARVAGHDRMPFVATLLTSPMTARAARWALASPFILSGLLKLLDFDAATQEAAALGLGAPAMLAIATIVTQLLGAALFLSQRLCWLGAGMLAVFTAVATLLVHAFWTAKGLEQVQQAATFFEHVALIGGFAVAAILVNGPSADE